MNTAAGSKTLGSRLCELLLLISGIYLSRSPAHALQPITQQQPSSPNTSTCTAADHTAAAKLSNPSRIAVLQPTCSTPLLPRSLKNLRLPRPLLPTTRNTSF